MSTDPSRTAVFTGTFDPITLGHLDVIRRGRTAVRAPGRRHRRQPEQAVAVHVEERVALAREVVVGRSTTSRSRRSTSWPSSSSGGSGPG